MTTMIDEKLARRRAHENNIARYRRLLQTRLSDVRTPLHREPPCRRADCPVNACSCSIVTLGVIGLFYLIDKHSMLEANPYYWFYPIGLLIGAGTIASLVFDDR
jgi:hypothetical protein